MIRSTALALCVWLLACLPAGAAGPKPLPGNSVYQLQARMLDQAGRPVQWRELRGKPRIVAMFYSNCPFMCPLIIETGKGIERTLTPAERARLGVVMVSLDPKRDTPAALSALVAKRKVDGRRWLLLQPRPQDLRAVAGLLKVRYRALADGEFNHTSAWVLLDAEGRELARTEVMGPQPAPEFLAAVRKALAI
jgi:protein SCO1/2